jgi:hypothetical protein
MVNIKGFAYNNVIKQTILHDSKMPSIYLEKCFYTDDSKLKKLGWNAQKQFSNEIQNIVNYYKK